MELPLDETTLSERMLPFSFLSAGVSYPLEFLIRWDRGGRPGRPWARPFGQGYAERVMPIEPTKYQNILVPLDGSTFSESAIPHAAALAGAFGGSIHLLRCFNLPLYLGLGFSADPVDGDDMWEEELANRRRRCVEKLETIRALLESDGYQATSRVRCGSPGARIEAEAREIGADLVVVASHARTGLARWLSHNLADQLYRECPCPVLILKGDPQDSPLLDQNLLARFLRELTPHSDVLASQLGVAENEIRRCLPSALARILAALAVEPQAGPGLKELLGQLRYYRGRVEDTRAFLQRGHHGPDLGLVAQIFNECASEAATELSQLGSMMTQKDSLRLMALVAPVVLYQLAELAEEESELRRLLEKEIRKSSGPAREAMNSTVTALT